MKIIKIISEWKKRPRKVQSSGNKPIKRGFKRVMAIVQGEDGPETRHVDIKI